LRTNNPQLLSTFFLKVLRLSRKLNCHLMTEIHSKVQRW